MKQLPNIVADVQRQQQAEAAIQMEVRKVAMDLYARLAGDYLARTTSDSVHALRGHIDEPATNPPLPDELRRIAWTCHKAAPYLHQAFGILNINEDEHWKDHNVTKTQ